jgi:hypothetical protein
VRKVLKMNAYIYPCIGHTNSRVQTSIIGQGLAGLEEASSWQCRGPYLASSLYA